jgi:hypothetical protein
MVKIQAVTIALNAFVFNPAKKYAVTGRGWPSLHRHEASLESSELARSFSGNGHHIVKLAISGINAKRNKFAWEKYPLQDCQGIGD